MLIGSLNAIVFLIRLLRLSSDSVAREAETPEMSLWFGNNFRIDRLILFSDSSNREPECQSRLLCVFGQIPDFMCDQSIVEC